MKKKIWMALALLSVLLAAASVACASHDYHTFGPYQVKRIATCKQTGLEIRYCTGCDHWEKREIPKLPHTPGEWVVTVEPTCTSKGAQETHCTACGDLMRTFIAMLPHEYGEMEVTVEPTCTQTGKGVSTCTGCGKTKTTTLDSLGHDWVLTEVTKEPTCKSTGSGTYTCQRCGKTKTGTIAKLEHEWGEWVITQEPSGKKKGTRESECALCGATTTERFYWEGTLYEDMEPNEEVIRLQEMLRDIGYYNGSIRSGTFGSLTSDAVAKFQKANGLEQTGIADPDTRELLVSVWEDKTGLSATDASSSDE